MDHQVEKVIEIVGRAEKGRAEAGDATLHVVSKTIKHITGVQVGAMAAQVRDGRISICKTTAKVSFVVEAEA